MEHLRAYLQTKGGTGGHKVGRRHVFNQQRAFPVLAAHAKTHLHDIGEHQHTRRLVDQLARLFRVAA